MKRMGITFNRRWAPCITLAVVLAGAVTAGAQETTGWDYLLSGAPLANAEAAFRKDLEAHPGDAGEAYGLALIQQAKGEREKAIVTAVEGLKYGPDNPLSFLLEDLISSDATFDLASTRLVSDSLPLLIASKGMDPVVRFNLNWLSFRLSARSGDPQRRKEAASKAGFLPGAFFSEPQTELTRTSFYKTWPEERGTFNPTQWSHSTLVGPFVRPPLYQMVTDRESNYLILVPFSVPSGTDALIYFNSARSYSVCLDDRTLFVKDVFESQENPTRLERVRLKAGAHRLLIKLHVQRGADGINLALLDPQGSALQVDWLDSIQAAASLKPAGFSDEGESRGSFWSHFPSNDPRFKGFEALWYRWQGDVARGRLLMEDAASRDPKCLPWNLWVAQTYLFEADDLPSKIAQSRAERGVDRALAVDGDVPMARFYKAVIQAVNSDSDDYLSSLRTLSKEAPADPRWSITLAERLQDKGWQHQARVFLEEASSYHPECESVLSAWVAFFRRLPDPAAEREIIEKIAKLRDASPEWEGYYENTNQFEKLHDLLLAEAARYGDRDHYYDEQLAKLEIRMEDYAAARVRLESMVKLDPDNPDMAFTLARCCFLMGDREGGFKVWSDVKRVKPDAFQVDMAHWVMGDALPFQQRHLDVDQVLSESANKPPDQAPSSLLLDQLFTRVQGDGSSLERYHGVVRINNKEGVDREGEQSLPGQIILSLRTIKPDGRILEPEQIPDKNTISMQGLEPGDVIEYEYITLKPPALVKKDAYITAQVYLFQDIEKPFHHTQWYMEYPSSMPMKFYEQNLPAPASQGEAGEMKWRNWEYRDMPRIAPEPDTPNKLLYVPMVEAVGGVTWKDLGLYLKEGVTGAFQITPEVQARYQEAVAGAKTPEEKLQYIVNYLLKEVDGERAAGWQDPTQTLLTRQGSRLPPACAFFKLAGIPFKVLVAEVVPDKIYREDLPRLGQFSTPVVEVDIPGSPARYLTLNSPYRNPDILPWYMQGASALAITESEPWKEVLIPTDLRPWSNALEKESRELQSNGDLKLEHSQTMDPESAESLRSSFKKIDKDQLRRAIQMALSRQYGNADLIDFHVDNLEDIRKPLIWNFDLLIRGYATKDGDRLTVSDPLPSLRLGQSLASLGERKLPLTTGGPIFVNQRFVITFPPGASVDYALPALDRSNRFGSYSIKGTVAEGEMTIERKVSLPFEIVWPKEYEEFASFLRKVDDAESGQLTVTLPASADAK